MSLMENMVQKQLQALNAHTHTHAHAQTNKQGITNTSNQLTNRLSGSGQDEILYIQDVTSLQNTAVPLADRL